MSDPYGDAAESAAPPADDERQADTEDAKPETALLVDSFFGDKDLKPGDKCTIEIVRGLSGEKEVRYIGKEEADEEETEPQMATAPTGASDENYE